jgi:uncharacterized protein
MRGPWSQRPSASEPTRAKPRTTVIMRRMRMLVRCGLACLGGWTVLCAAIGIIAAEGALHPRRMALDPNGTTAAQLCASRAHASFADVTVRAEDGVLLRGWSIRNPSGNRDEVIVLHGQSANREVMLGTADLLLRYGYSVLLPDSRNHGESGGQIATYGVLESGDLRRWVDWLEQSEAPHCVYALGDSMGAAEALQSLVKVPEFCAVVAEGTFASFRDAAYDRLGQQLGTGPWLGRTLLRPAVDLGMVYVRFKYGVDLSQASPERAVARTRVPVLLIHGLADSNLPPRHSEKIKASNSNVALWEPRFAGHCAASETEPQEYERRVIGWFKIHDQPQIVDSRFGCSAQ